MPIKAKIITAREIPSTAAERRGALDTLIVYEIENGGQHVAIIPLAIAAVTEDVLLGAIKAAQGAITGLVGKVLDIP